MAHVARLTLCAGLIQLLFFARRSTGTWANPVGFYAGAFVVVALGQELFVPALPFSIAMSGLIYGSALVLYLGLLVTWRRPEVYRDPPTLPESRRLLRSAGLYGSFALALLYLYELRQARATGLGTSDDGLFVRAEFFASGGQTMTLRVLQVLTYCGVLYVSFEVRRRRWPLLTIAAFLTIVLAQGVLFSSKLPTLISMLLVVAVVAAGRPSMFRRIGGRVLAGGAGALFILLLTFQIVTAARHRGTVDATATLEYAILGPPSAYSLVLDGQASVQLDPRWGLTVAGTRDILLGAGNTRQFGVFAQSVQLDPDKPESSTNIYTWFVALNHDFGLAGTFVVVFGLGLIAGALSTRQAGGRLGVAGQTGLALLDLELMFAPIFTLSYYNVLGVLVIEGLGLSLLYAARPLSARLPRLRGRSPATVSRPIAGTLS